MVKELTLLVQDLMKIKKNKSRAVSYVKEIERLGKCADICSKIYIARNITLSEKDLLDALKECDRLMRDKSGGN